MSECALGSAPAKDGRLGVRRERFPPAHALHHFGVALEAKLALEMRKREVGRQAEEADVPLHPVLAVRHARKVE